MIDLLNDGMSRISYSDFYFEYFKEKYYFLEDTIDYMSVPRVN